MHASTLSRPTAQITLSPLVVFALAGGGQAEVGVLRGNNLVSEHICPNMLWTHACRSAHTAKCQLPCSEEQKSSLQGSASSTRLIAFTNKLIFLYTF